MGYGTSNNNGDVQSQTINWPGLSTITQLYQYDGVNRLKLAAENSSNPSNPGCPDAPGSWCQQYGYDAFGNRAISESSNLGVSPNAPTSFDAATNQNRGGAWSASSYDASGNIITDALGTAYTYDAENRQITAGGASYAYDGNGQRVMKTVDGVQSVYVYDALGNLAAEYGGPTNPLSGTVYLTGDMLGSSRLITSASNTLVNGTSPGAAGTCIEARDYLPFGEEISVTSGSARSGFGCLGNEVGVRQKFTSKERDSESGLDYFGARYMSSAQGRFTSPDEFSWIGTTDAFTGEPVRQLNPLPYADINNPQSLNKYGYVLNNPLRYIDPDGHCVSGTIDTLICLAAGVAVAKIITDFLEWKTNLDETKTYVAYYNSLLDHAIAVCSAGKQECQAALDAAERARLATIKKGVKTVKAAISLPGTFVGGPLPTSRNDLAVSTIQNLLTAPLDNTEDKAQQEKKPQSGEPNPGDPVVQHKTCLQDRDGNCVP